MGSGSGGSAISIHAPHTGRDRPRRLRLCARQFQSTRPIRGATRPRAARPTRGGNFNPRAPYGARPAGPSQDQPVLPSISIHAPHTGRDFADWGGPGPESDFNPRAPYGARPTWVPLHQTCGLFQSTRPIRGATPFRHRLYGRAFYFNPRAPYGARQLGLDHRTVVLRISIHAPHTGRDRAILGLVGAVQVFQSTRPIRGATRYLLSLPP